MTIQSTYSPFGFGARGLVTGPLALSVTAGLFFTMQALVKQGDVSISNDTPRIFHDVFVGQIIYDPVPVKRLVKPPEAVPAPNPVQSNSRPGTTESINVGPSLKPTPPTPGDIDFNFGMVDGAAVALVRIAPQYPRRAQASGTEGWVMVRFDVGASGEVLNPVVEAAEPSGVFDRAALKAIMKFKYKPKVVDGRAVPYSGVRYRFQFNLQE